MKTFLFFSLIFQFYITLSYSMECSQLPQSDFECIFNCSCILGMQSSANCSVSNTIICNGSRNFSLPFICQYCFQLPENETYCDVYTGCSSNRNQYYISNCTASPQILCLGNRQFQKLVKCNFVGTKSWSTAFWLSILLGGFAADRFYLGYIGWGIFKLLSFGGLGLWTLIDAILIAVGHLGPADGSLYV